MYGNAYGTTAYGDKGGEGNGGSGRLGQVIVTYFTEMDKFFQLF